MKNQILLTILILSNFLFSQNWLRVDSVFSPSGVKVNNFSCPFFADLDGDGKKDLILGNGASQRIKFFKNLGPDSNPKFLEDTTIFSSIYAAGFQGTNSDYPCAVDLNGDNLLDLIVGGFNGILYYQNIGTATNPAWRKVDTIFASINNGIGTDAKPAFADLDGDGDLDLVVGIGESLFGGPTAGITIAFRNTGTAQAPVFKGDNSLVANIPDVGLNSYPALADLNNDGDYDMLLGRDLGSFIYYENTGSPQTPVWTRNNSTFQPVETSTYWKNPTFYDLNNDGLIDLIYGNSNGKLYYYKNIGTETNPQYLYDKNFLSIIKINESASTVSFIDYDGDGDLDLLSGNWLGRVEYFRNDGNKFTPAFNRMDMNFSFINVSSYSSPVFVDIDGDGDIDIVTGALNGKLSCFINIGVGFVQNTTILANINVGGFSHPAFADIDADGDLDLFVGAEYATNAKFFRNLGNNNFQPDDSLMYNLVLNRSSKPSFGDVDNDGDFDLVIGDAWGELSFYENIGNKYSPIWSRKDNLLDNIKVRQSSAPGLADLDGDKKLDLTIGDYDGNFTFYKNIMNISSLETTENIPDNFSISQNFPNPFNSTTSFYLTLPYSSGVNLNLYDILGKKIELFKNKYYEAGTHLIRLNLDNFNLRTGVYFYEVEISGKEKLINKKIIKKLLILN